MSQQPPRIFDRRTREPLGVQLIRIEIPEPIDYTITIKEEDLTGHISTCV